MRCRYFAHPTAAKFLIGESQMAKALYRKYRPKRFSDVIGQDAICAALKNQVSSGKVSHAYMLTGIRGTGKTTLAKILSKAVNCPNQKDGEPCCECDVCRGIDTGAILDVTEIDAASNNSVDDIRQLKEESSFAPAVCRYRIYIIDEVHMLTPNAWAALLKIIEEPPAHIMFILATTDIQKVPATILSRCQRFDLHRISAGDIQGYIKGVAEKENIEITDGAAARLSRMADGAMRDALSLLDTCASTGAAIDEDLVIRLTGTIDRSYLFRMADYIIESDLTGLTGLLSDLYKGSMEPVRLCNELMKHYRNLLVAGLGCSDVLTEYSDEERAELAEHAKKYSRRSIFRVMDLLKELGTALQTSTDKRLTCEIMLMSLANSFAAQDEPVREERHSFENVKPVIGTKELKVQSSEEKPEERRQIQPQAEKNTQEAQKTARITPVDGWHKVIASIDDGLLGGFLADTSAYLDEKRLLISGNDMFFSFMREHPEANTKLKECISRVLGIQRPIGPYRETDAAVRAAAAEKRLLEEETEKRIDDLIKTAEENGVEVIVK